MRSVKLTIKIFKMKNKQLTKHSIVILIVLSTSTIISSAIPSVNTFPKRQEFGVCNSACQQEINNAVSYTDTLHQQQTANHDSLLKRVIDLENDFYGSIGTINSLLGRVTNLETYLARNVTALNSRITDESNSIYVSLSDDINFLRGDLNTKLNNLTNEINILKYQQPATPPPPITQPGSAIDVYYNVTRRIDGLEYGKIANLSTDNNIWRRNFRVVNATFERMKNNNNCMCM